MSDTDSFIFDDKYLFTFQDETQLWISKEFIEKYPQLPFYDIIQHSEKYDDGSYYIDLPFSPMEKVIHFLLEENMDISSLNFKDNPYASNIPLEYICPLCIKDIFPSLEELKIKVVTYYKKSDELLNPNNEEYITTYSRLFSRYDYKIKNPEEYDYYTESEINEYNKISSLDRKSLYTWNSNHVNVYNERREKNQLPKLYKYIADEAKYTNNYSEVNKSEINDECTKQDEVIIQYDDKTSDKTFIIDYISTEWGMYQLLRLPSYFSITQITNKPDQSYSKYSAKLILKALKEGVFDFLTTLSVVWIEKITDTFSYGMYSTIMSTHLFPNVTTLLYDNSGKFTLTSIKKKCFPKLHIINYEASMLIDNFELLFPMDLISMIDTIHIHKFIFDPEEEKASFFNDLVYNYSIHIDGIVDTYKSENIKKLDYFTSYKQNIDCLNIEFNNYEEENNNSNQSDVRNSLERFLKSSVLQNLNDLTIKFDGNMTKDYLNWVSSLFNDNKFNTIHKITIRYFTIHFINQLIREGYFHNTTELNFFFSSIPNNNFCKLYTTNNFPQLKSINLCIYRVDTWYKSFIEKQFKYIHNNNFPTISILRLCEDISSYGFDDFIYNRMTSILRCKYDDNSFIDTVIGNDNVKMSKYELEILFDYINNNKTQNLKYIEIFFYDEKQIPKFINFIITGKIPKLREFIFYVNYYVLQQKRDIYEQQLSDSSFIQQNHVDYRIESF
ncbi:hypothetical protein WA158_007089 [Blastocystis sp. Blastoise]